LVAEGRNGYLWAIQAKADDAAYRVTKQLIMACGTGETLTALFVGAEASRSTH
jgi:predicted helicase